MGYKALSCNYHFSVQLLIDSKQAMFMEAKKRAQHKKRKRNVDVLDIKNPKRITSEALCNVRMLLMLC